MEAVGLALAVPSIIILCASAVKELRLLMESMRTANKTLLSLLSRAERVRLFLDALRGLACQLKDHEHKSLLLAFGEESYRNTLRSIRELVRQVSMYSETPMMLKAYWITQKHKAAALVKSLQAHEIELATCLTMISTKASISTQEAVSKMKLSIGRQAQIQDKFEALKISEDEDFADDETLVDQQIIEEPNEEKTLPMWPGHVIWNGFNGEYVEAREKVANAAFCGDWKALEEALTYGYQKYGELWGNSVRIKANIDEASFWTPLHQAAVFGAPIEVIRMLESFGALRTQRTRWADAVFSYVDLTAEEIAREMGFTDLARVLAPMVYHPVPHGVLAKLQRVFHDMIISDSSGQPWEGSIVLPELTALTELENPDMWFPVGQNMGYRYCLDNRELVVSKVRIEAQDLSIYRITADNGWWPVKRAVIFNR